MYRRILTSAVPGTLVALIALVGLAATSTGPVSVDESVFVDGLAPGERESILYIWTRDGDGKDSDFLAVVDVAPGSETYGQVIETVPTGSAGNETHHFGYTTDTDRIFGGGLFSNQLFIYDVETDPHHPELIRTVDLDATGYSGPHTLYAVPGGVMLAMLGRVDGGGPAGLVKVDDAGDFIEAYPEAGSAKAPEYMYDVGVKPAMNRMITSSFTHPHDMKMAGGAPPAAVGDDVVIWDWEEKEILRTVQLDPGPLEVRWLHGRDTRGGFINCVFGGTVWYWEDDDRDGRLEFHQVIQLPATSAPADMRISYDNRYLYVSLFGGGAVRQYDVSNPLEPELIDTIELNHPNMMKLTPDSKRLYVTNSLMSNMDPDQRFRAWLLHVGPEGMALDPAFDPDFTSFPTGPAGPHDMLLK